MLKYKINKFLDLRFENGKTNIYVNNNLFRHCNYILLNISSDNSEILENISSIDEAVEKLDGSFEFLGEISKDLNPEILFWAHCSNLQAWYENDYNSCIIHSNLAFPLLKELTNAGDLIAKKVFVEEIAKKFESNNIHVIQFLLYNGYLNYMNVDEREFVIEVMKENLIENIVNQLYKFIKSTITDYYKIKELIDIILFIDLKYNESLIFCIVNELRGIVRMKFVRLLLLHLNYKEFLNYRIPYGKFFIYFEKILNNFYENYPEIKELLKIIDSGFLGGSFSLDEAFSYGTQSYP